MCDGQDTNCDGLIDNMSRCVRACAGAVISGTLSCTPQGAVCELPAEICGDGVDNDCDFTIDEDCAGGAPRFLDMVYIPGGTFLQGSSAQDAFAQDDERPVHAVELEPYYIDRFEVTRAQYAACAAAGVCLNPVMSGACQTPQPLSGISGKKPIACVGHVDAQMYCGWLGKRLPSESEWEKAARGAHDSSRRWPWGDEQEAQRAAMSCVGSLDECVRPVDTLPEGASPYGLHHMAGNVAEYVADYYADNYYPVSPASNPLQTTPTGGGFVVRGGSWRQRLSFGRVANRGSEKASSFEAVDVGFRCAQSAR